MAAVGVAVARFHEVVEVNAQTLAVDPDLRGRELGVGVRSRWVTYIPTPNATATPCIVTPIPTSQRNWYFTSPRPASRGVAHCVRSAERYLGSPSEGNRCVTSRTQSTSRQRLVAGVRGVHGMQTPTHCSRTARPTNRSGTRPTAVWRTALSATMAIATCGTDTPSTGAKSPRQS